MRISTLIKENTVFLTGDVDHRFYKSALKLYHTIKERRWEDITIYINSDGGDAAICSAVVFLLRDLQKKGVYITMVASGYVASAGAIIFMQGDERYAMPDSRILIHKPSISSWKYSQNENDLKEQLKHLKRKNIWDDYLKGVKLTDKQRKAYNDGLDVDFSVNQCLKNGILTGRLT